MSFLLWTNSRRESGSQIPLLGQSEESSGPLVSQALGWEISAHLFNFLLVTLKRTQHTYSWKQTSKEGGQEDFRVLCPQRSTGLPLWIKHSSKLGSFICHPWFSQALTQPEVENYQFFLTQNYPELQALLALCLLDTSSHLFQEQLISGGEGSCIQPFHIRRML